MGSAGGGGVRLCSPWVRIPAPPPAFRLWSSFWRTPESRRTKKRIGSGGKVRRQGEDGVRSRAGGGSFCFVEPYPPRISLRTNRSASATFPPLSVGNDPQGGSVSRSFIDRVKPSFIGAFSTAPLRSGFTLKGGVILNLSSRTLHSKPNFHGFDATSCAC